MYSLKNVNSYFEIINKIENYLKDVYSDHYYKLFYNYLLINKMYFFYYYVIYGPLKIQRKYYKSFPEIYIFINNKNYSRLTVLIIKFLSKKYFFIEKILLRLNSIYLIIRKNITFKFYFQN